MCGDGEEDLNDLIAIREMEIIFDILSLILFIRLLPVLLKCSTLNKL
jgi:hypothetical protein